MQIIRATHLGMCFGVKDALHLARESSSRGPLTVLGELVHNVDVLDDLKARGVLTQSSPPDSATMPLMITAHGISERRRSTLNGFKLVDATCPLVHFAHRALKRLVNEGCFPVIIGRAGHVEVNGLVEDYPEFAIILNPSDLLLVPNKPCYGVVAQTTQPLQRVNELVKMLGQRFPGSNIKYADTVCQPTKQRQTAAVELASKCTVVVVVGGSHSNNTRELESTCRQFCSRVHHVERGNELKEEWFFASDIVGITAGTSTPDTVIQSVEDWMQELKTCLEAGMRIADCFQWV